MPIQLDAKLSAFRRSPKGFFITLEVNPDSDWEELARAPLGTAFGVAMIPFDPETGKRVDASPDTRESPADRHTGQQRGEVGKPSKERKPFDSLPLSQQAALLCNDGRFRVWWRPDDAPSVPDMADMMRNYLGIESRAELDDPDRPSARDGFRKMLADYRQATGQAAEVRG